MQQHIVHPPQPGRPARKIAWITGASSGIGSALALRLCGDGWTVAVSARSGEALAALAREKPGAIHAFPLDITDRNFVFATLSEIEESLGPVDLAVFCAGTYARDYAQGFSSTVLADMVNLNIVGTAHCLDAVMARMIARGSGHIAVTASVTGYVGLPGGASYGATKAALNVLCEALYPELAAKGVALTVINPGFVDTPLTAKNDFPMPFIISSEEAADIIARGLSTKRFEIIFPWKMALAIRLLHALPHSMRFAITKRMLR
ncbi:MAG: SDR family NAD(P)-dependent oxidoreductase [Allorhizobium sp.]